MYLFPDELEDLHCMIVDAATLSRGTDQALSWTRLRDALTREAAYAYLRTEKPEYIFTAVLLRSVDSPHDWTLARSWLQKLLNGETLPLAYRTEGWWAGCWSYVLQLTFKAHWEAQDAFVAKFFKWG